MNKLIRLAASTLLAAGLSSPFTAAQADRFSISYSTGHLHHILPFLGYSHHGHDSRHGYYSRYNHHRHDRYCRHDRHRGHDRRHGHDRHHDQDRYYRYDKHRDSHRYNRHSGHERRHHAAVKLKDRH